MLICPSCRCQCPDDGRFCPSCGQLVSAIDEASDGEDLIGRALCSNRYRVDALLGRGGMGTVYRALDMRLGRQVALKVLALELVAHPTARMRMTQEGQALARIEHANVVRVFDVFDEGPLLVIVLELVTGGSLEDLIRAGGIGESRTLQLADGMLAGLEAVHRAGLVHRDVKPGNILLTADGVPKVADLGVARDTTAQGKTRLGQKLGTLEYMSPEQAQGLQVTASADIYAAGLVVFELLTGTLPFTGHTEFDWALAHVKLQPNLMPLEGKASAQVRDAIAQALAKSPDERFASARAMAAALTASTAAAPVKASPAADADTGAATMALPRPVEPALADPHVHAAGGSGRGGAVLGVGALGLVIVGGIAYAMLGSDGRGSAAAAATVTAAPVANGDLRLDDNPREPDAAPSGGNRGRPAEPEPAPARVAEPDPTSGVTGYYEALNRRDLAGAYAHWGMSRAASESAWRKNFGEQAHCARVLSAREKLRSGSDAAIDVDLCVDDQRAGEVHRWRGTINVTLDYGVWKMKSWTIGKRGLCNADCSPPD